MKVSPSFWILLLSTVSHMLTRTTTTKWRPYGGGVSMRTSGFSTQKHLFLTTLLWVSPLNVSLQKSRLIQPRYLLFVYSINDKTCVSSLFNYINEYMVDKCGKCTRKSRIVVWHHFQISLQAGFRSSSYSAGCKPSSWSPDSQMNI